MNTDTGWKSPTSDGAIWNNWTNPSNAYVDNANYATLSGIKTQDYGTFTLDVDAGSVRITGIEVGVKGYKEQAGDTTMGIQLSWDGGTNKTASQNVVISGGSVEAMNSVGGNWNDWGHTWTTDELSNANFWAGFTSSNSGNDYDVNYIRVKIYYQLCSSSSSSSSFSSCSSSFSSSSFSSTSSSFSSCSSSLSSYSSSCSSCSSSFSSSCSSSSFSSSSF